MGEAHLVMLVTDHDDTAELYSFALERVGYHVQRFRTPQEVVDACRYTTPLAVVVHFTPRHEPITVGTALRALSMRTVLIGLFSVQLSIAALKQVLDSFDDVLMIPCSPDLLVGHVERLEHLKRRQASA